jgi:hypothetical protein
MIRTHGVRLGVALFVGAATLGLSGCGAAVISADSAQKSVADFVAKNTEVTASDVKCPDKTEAKVGVEFDCTFTAPDGDYVAHLKITKVDGTDVEYDIESKPA